MYVVPVMSQQDFLWMSGNYLALWHQQNPQKGSNHNLTFVMSQNRRSFSALIYTTDSSISSWIPPKNNVDSFQNDNSFRKGTSVSDTTEIEENITEDI